MSKQPVEAGALDDIFKLLFKGLDNLFDSAAEYQNDMGKLKKVTKIPVTKDKKEYTVLIKLAPIKDRENMYYVEIDDGGCPGLDFSKYNEKPMRIDKNNREEFEKLIDKILDDAGVERQVNPSDIEEQQGRYSVDCYNKDEFDEWSFEGQQGPHPVIIEVSAEIIPTSGGKVKLIVKRSDNKKLRFDDHDLHPDDVTDIPSPKVKEVVNKIIRDSKLVPVEDAEETDESAPSDMSEPNNQSTESEEGTPAASYVDVSLSYIKSSEEVHLDAIYANYNVADAMKAVEQVVDDDDFVALLTEEPQSFRITDEGDDFDVTEIGCVDTSCMTEDIYNAITLLDDLLQTYYINMDAQQQTAAMEVSSTLQKARSLFKSDDIVNEL